MESDRTDLEEWQMRDLGRYHYRYSEVILSFSDVRVVWRAAEETAERKMDTVRVVSTSYTCSSCH